MPETNPGTVFSRQEGELRQCVLGMAGVGCSRGVDNANITGRYVWEGGSRSPRFPNLRVVC